jgi:chlorophyll(ide) b reductase
MNIVISGASKGLGKALAKEFIKSGDNVIIISRTNLTKTLFECNSKNISGYQIDVGNIKQMNKFKNIIKKKFKKVDIFINNAGYSSGYNLFENMNDKQLNQIIVTNLFGSLLLTKKAIEIIQNQSSPGHIFFISGSTNNIGYSAYGATKKAILQFSINLQKEIKDPNIGIHMISPGMMSTPLLLENLPSQLNNIIKYFIIDPEKVAENIVPRIKKTVSNNKKNDFIRYFDLLNIFKNYIKL